MWYICCQTHAISLYRLNKSLQRKIMCTGLFFYLLIFIFQDFSWFESVKSFQSYLIWFHYITLTPKEEAKGRLPMAVPGNFAVIWKTKAWFFLMSISKLVQLKHKFILTRSLALCLFLSHTHTHKNKYTHKNKHKQNRPSPEVFFHDLFSLLAGSQHHFPTPWNR